MAEFKQHRDNEHKVHEQLYGNLFLLSQFYPTSKEFNSIFKKDMFIKNNKTAFFQVVHFLLNILNPELTKEKLPSWFPYDIKTENKFRIELLKYINELNTFHDNADIPHIMSSHFISPGGLKFTKFILKLSQLVVFEHLKRTEDTHILYCPKPSKNINLTKVNLTNLKRKTAVIERETSDMMKEFHNFHFTANERAVSIDKELTTINDNIREARKENEVVKGDFNRNHPAYPSLDTLEAEINSLKCQYEGFQRIRELFKECGDLVSYLSSNKLVLEHCKEDLKLPNDVLHIVQNREVLDLTEFFKGLNWLLEKKALEFPYPTSSIGANLEMVGKLSAKYTEINNTLTENVKELQGTLDKISQQFKLLIEADAYTVTEEVLAVPLVEIET